ncbi:SprT family zinc-dependent metalloprotease [uncultured Methanospirillum sp.]|uniref:M48 family metallopeptidase n=1 Tax=uncultured Methanospirillum sp. TaxID=262503 RepID=UPI0029C7FCCF|nr:SprT family zinc-dependent metalloprotease [uncultured Methanospirillum sp.]
MQTPLPGFLLPPLPENYSDHFPAGDIQYRYRVIYDREISRLTPDISESGELRIIAPPSLSSEEICRIVRRDGKKLFRIREDRPTSCDESECRSLLIGDEEIPYHIRISVRAKGMTLKISPLLQITVVVPPGYSTSDLLTFLESSKEWIADKTGRTDLLRRNEEPSATVMAGDRTIPYKIRTSRRAKRIVLKVLTDGSVEVVAPPKTDPTLIHRFVTEKADWILKKTSGSRPILQAREYKDGEILPLLGKEVCLSVQTGASKPVADLTDLILTVKIPDGLDPLTARELVKKEYKKILTQTLEKNVHEIVPGLSSRLGIQPPRIRYGEQKTHWGVCTPRGITLNIRLAMAPEDLIEYVVVHELCHIRHPNHSARFWKLVEDMLPDYKLTRARLKQDGNLFRP